MLADALNRGAPRRKEEAGLHCESSRRNKTSVKYGKSGLDDVGGNDRRRSSKLTLTLLSFFSAFVRSRRISHSVSPSRTALTSIPVPNSFVELFPLRRENCVSLATSLAYPRREAAALISE